MLSRQEQVSTGEAQHKLMPRQKEEFSKASSAPGLPLLPFPHTPHRPSQAYPGFLDLPWLARRGFPSPPTQTVSLLPVPQIAS